MTEKKDVAVAQPDPFIEMVGKLAENPDIDADKVQKFLDMQLQIMDRKARDEFYVAMNLVQAALPTVLEDAENTHTRSRYAKHEAIARAIKPIYTAEGFSASFGEEKTETEDYIRVTGVLRHTAGHSEPYYVELPLDKAGKDGTVNKTALHATGSTFTYGRRYLTLLMFDVATGDDTDGNMPDDVVTEEQAANIAALMDEVKADKHRFLKWCQVKCVEDIPAKHFKFVIDELERKREEPDNGDS